MHIIFTGFPYPHGMAGTKRNEHAIRALRTQHGVKISVLVTRQPTPLNPPDGVIDGVSYFTVMPNTLRTAFALKYPFYFFKARHLLKQTSNRVDDSSTILYIYGPPSLDNIPLICTAKYLGCKIIFDIVEDDELTYHISTSYWHRINNTFVRLFTRTTLKWADGLIVISGHLKNKMNQMVAGSTPILLRPISVDFSWYQSSADIPHETIDFLYSGSFAMKDGVDVLIDAFEALAGKYSNIRLFMTGTPINAGSLKKMIERSQHKDRIIFLGYLSDCEYYKAIMNADILCVPRIDLPYAHAGFPFKLGEFLASGKPVVVSRTGDVELYLKDKDSAMLINPGSAASIVNAGDFLISNRDVARSIGQKGRDIAVGSFDYLAQSKDLYSFLKKVSCDQYN